MMYFGQIAYELEIIDERHILRNVRRSTTSQWIFIVLGTWVIAHAIEDQYSRKWLLNELWRLKTLSQWWSIWIWEVRMNSMQSPIFKKALIFYKPFSSKYFWFIYFVVRIVLAYKLFLGTCALYSSVIYDHLSLGILNCWVQY